jgi:hypothetical protein
MMEDLARSFVCSSQWYKSHRTKRAVRPAILGKKINGAAALYNLDRDELAGDLTARLASVNDRREFTSIYDRGASI